ncbi:hypothetical protein NKG05_11895 [Oerskovia sp. M15]
MANCAVNVTQNPQDEPYTFDKGFSGFGTGVGCTAVDGVLHLAGLNAMSNDGDTYVVARTFIDLDESARRASNGQTETVAEGAPSSDPVVVTAQETSCGDLVAGGDAREDRSSRRAEPGSGTTWGSRPVDDGPTSCSAPRCAAP